MPPTEATPFLKRGAVIHVSFQLALPADASRGEIMEWVQYELGHNGSIECENPLYDEEIQPLTEPSLTETGRYSWNELVSKRREENSTIFSTRQVLGSEPPAPGVALSSSETCFRESMRHE